MAINNGFQLCVTDDSGGFAALVINAERFGGARHFVAVFQVFHQSPDGRQSVIPACGKNDQMGKCAECRGDSIQKMQDRAVTRRRSSREMSARNARGMREISSDARQMAVRFGWVIPGILTSSQASQASQASQVSQASPRMSMYHQDSQGFSKILKDSSRYCSIF